MALAHAAGLHATYIGQIENGRRNLALLNVVALAEALEVEVADLFRDPS
jgi:transcriptional regulator with XRE-family HTH domain